MGLVTVLLIGFMLAISSRVSHQDMSLLYGGLEVKEASDIVNRLAALGVKHEIRGDSQIYVPQKQVGTLRLQIAGEGLVGSSSTGYEIFDDTSSFGTTSLIQNINARRALEGELARTITSLPVVKAARVHIVMPKRQLFSRNQTKASASVTLNIGSRSLEEDQINGMVQLVAAAIPDLSPNNVTIIDNRGKLLSSGKGEPGVSSNGNSPSVMFRTKLEQEYEASITRILEPVVGQGRVSAKVSATVNFDRIEENSEIFNPEQQVVRSEQRVEEESKSENTEPGAPAGLAANVPGQNPQGFQVSRTENDGRIEETVNYEISRTVRHFIREGGSIDKLSVAVLVEGNYVTIDGESQYVPITDENKQKLEALVRRSIGFSESRGDKIELIDMQFRAIEEVEMFEPPLLSKSDIMRLIEYGLLFIGLLMIILFVVKPILKAAHVQADAEQVPASSSQDDADSIAQKEAETMIDLAKVEGRVRESTIIKATEIIDANPEQSVAVVRSWLTPETPEED